MLRLNNKKNGFTIIEVMCSFAVFTIMFLLAMSIKLCTVKMELYNNELKKYDEYIENIKTDILSNTSNDEINELILDGKIYIPSEKINEIYLNDNKIEDLFDSTVPIKKPYAELNVTNTDNTYLEKINITLYTNIQGKNENINAIFFKGNYK
jgi:prepilin-type N-terminal cleavage/methylation domain-containing protein